MSKVFFKSKTIGAGNNAKTIKGDGESGYVTAILYLKPAKIDLGGKVMNSCANAEVAGCESACLYTAGRGRMSNVQAGRIGKTEWFYADRDGFMIQLVKDVEAFERKAIREGLTPVLRLNGTSDIRWELIPVERGGVSYASIFDAFPHLQFYDYTKIANRRSEFIENYHLTFSYSEANPAYVAQVKKALGRGMNLAAVFRDKTHIPETFLGLPVCDGDKDDLRFLDPSLESGKGQHVVALYAKGSAKKDQSGFVVDTMERNAA